VTFPAQNPLEADGTRFVDDTLLVGGEEVALRGARCPSCATTTFPPQRGCPKCGKQHMSIVALPRTGTLWSFTVQNFRPKTPYRSAGEFEPYGVGYVDLGEVIVESRLVESRPEELSIGQFMRLCFVPSFLDDDGTTVLTFAFGREDS
jgi:uncharacterized protein